MQLSTFNKLLKFFSIKYVTDDIGGFTKKYEYLFTVFGGISVVKIDKNGQKKYQITIDARNTFNELKDNSLILYDNQQFIIKNISMDKKLIKIECYDNQNTEDLI